MLHQKLLKMLSFIENKARCLWSCTYVAGTNASKTLEVETELKICQKVWKILFKKYKMLSLWSSLKSDLHDRIESGLLKVPTTDPPNHRPLNTYPLTHRPLTMPTDPPTDYNQNSLNRRPDSKHVLHFSILENS